MDSTNKGPETSAGEQFPLSEKQDPNQSVQLTTQETSTARAQKSGGPKTQQGKETSRQNSLKHGIFSTKVVVLKRESEAEFEDLLDGLRTYFQPEGTLEEILVEKLAALFWRERRLIIADAEADIGNGMDFLALKQSPEWDILLRYETTLDRAIDRTLAQLERYQRIRLGHPVPPPINVNVSSS
jgi:hypothetical protein